MADPNINLYALLGMVESLLIALLVSGVLFVQLRGARRRVAEMQQQLRQAESQPRRDPPPAPPTAAPEPVPQRDYADFLRDELALSDRLLGDNGAMQADDAAAADADAALLRQMLAARHQFLQLELDVQGMKSTADVEAQRRSIAMGMQALLEGLQPPEAPAAAPETVENTDAPPGPVMRSEVHRLEDQISHLRGVIDNQHSVMRELRNLLEEHGNDSEELQEALRKLGDAEAQAVEFQRCLEVMDHENRRLKTGTVGNAASAAGPDADMLRDLVGSQQRTIGKLQHMLQSLAPDPGKAKELGEAINKIQRANSELNSCVMVLEDENAMLRVKVETLEERLADLEANAAPPRPAQAAAVAADPMADIDRMFDEAAGMAPAAAAPPAAEAADETALDTDQLLAELFGGGTEGTSR